MYWDQRLSEVFATLYTNMEILSELSSVKITWNQSEDRNSTADSILYYVQEEIEKGTDGILICPPNDQVLPMICRMCEEANVYWGIYFRSIMDENIRAVCEASPYYIGNAYEDEETNAYLLTKKCWSKDIERLPFYPRQSGIPPVPPGKKGSTGRLRRQTGLRSWWKLGISVPRRMQRR